MTSESILNIISSVLPKFQYGLIFSMMPFLYMSLLVLLPAFTGVTIMIGEYPLDEVKVLEDPERETISELYLTLFTIYTIYIQVEMALWMLWIILRAIKTALDTKGKLSKNKKVE